MLSASLIVEESHDGVARTAGWGAMDRAAILRTIVSGAGFASTPHGNPDFYVYGNAVSRVKGNP